MDLVDLFDKASAWTKSKIAGAADLSAETPCSDWKVKDLVNHCVNDIAVQGARPLFVGKLQVLDKIRTAARGRFDVVLRDFHRWGLLSAS